jgi:hypothetical protein
VLAVHDGSWVCVIGNRVRGEKETQNYSRDIVTSWHPTSTLLGNERSKIAIKTSLAPSFFHWDPKSQHVYMLLAQRRYSKYTTSDRKKWPTHKIYILHLLNTYLLLTSLYKCFGISSFRQSPVINLLTSQCTRCWETPTTVNRIKFQGLHGPQSSGICQINRQS